jgi:FtsP/CotA-like multicopper oxidase with cupredoxin domain
MYNTPWSDGVPGLTQKPIEPGQRFVYRFEANPPGQYWYHAHSRGTLQDGLYGGLYIRHKPTAPRPFDLISTDRKDIAQMRKAEHNPNQMMLSDWTNATSWDYMNVQRTSGAAFL